MDGGRALRYWRRRAGLTQRQLGQKAGVRQPAVARIERGAVVPRVDTLDRLLEACGAGLYARERRGMGVDRTEMAAFRRWPEEGRLRVLEQGSKDAYRFRSAARRSLGYVSDEPTAASVAPILRTLVEHGVAFVLIGGRAANIHGSPSLTLDVDICYARDEANLERLARALQDLDATLRGAPRDLPLQLDARMLRNGDHFTFETRYGDFDCLGTPAGVSGFAELERNALEVEVEGMTIRVAAIDDLIRMKEAAGRPKDRVEIEILGALQEEIDRGQEHERRRRDR